MNIYYVYVYYCQQSIPFYVGYGKKNRMFDHLNEAKKSPKAISGEHKLNKIRKILKEGFEPRIEIVAYNLTRDEATKLEIELIEKFGRSDLGLGTLTNMTKGGDGVVEWSDEMRKRLSEKCKGITVYKDLETGEKFKLCAGDKLLENENIVGVNYGSQGVSNPNGQLDGYILAKDPVTGEVFRVKPDDSRWESGELVGFNKGVECHENTRIAASKKWNGVPKSKEHNKKVSEAMKKLKWFYNKETDKIIRVVQGTEPIGFTLVSGPHKKMTSEQIEEEKKSHKEDVIRRRTNGEQTETRSKAQLNRYIENPLLGVTEEDLTFIRKVLKEYERKPEVPKNNRVGRILSYERSFANCYSEKLCVSQYKVYSIVSGKKNRILKVLSEEKEFRGVCNEIINNHQQQFSIHQLHKHK